MAHKKSSLTTKDCLKFFKFLFHKAALRMDVTQFLVWNRVLTVWVYHFKKRTSLYLESCWKLTNWVHPDGVDEVLGLKIDRESD